jgi:lipoprotein-releasing system permease protein
LFFVFKLEKIVMFLVLAIIILVASFSIGCNLIMVVRKKRQEIATLKSMGADNPSIYRIFVIEGLYIGVIGMLLGLGVGLLLCMFLQFFGLRLDPEIYYISKLPVQIDAGEVAAICGACLAISFAATIYPAWQAAQLHPVEAFRNE